MQTILAFTLVLACAVYACWLFMPHVLQRGLAKQLLALPWPARMRDFWQRAAQNTSSCACHGCERNTPTLPQAQPPKQAWQPILLRPRKQEHPQD